MYNRYGFGFEMSIELNKKKEDTIKKFKNILDRLPSAIFLKFENDPKYFQVIHGGIDSNIDPKILDYSGIFNNVNYQYNGLKWSDFDMGEVDLSESSRGAGELYGQTKTKNYLDKNNLYSIISGPQDQESLSILPTEILTQNTIQLFSDNCKVYYGGRDGKLYCPNYDNEIIDLDPTEDFLALITSTATGPRNTVQFDTFLELSTIQLGSIVKVNRTIGGYSLWEVTDNSDDNFTVSRGLIEKPAKNKGYERNNVIEQLQIELANSDEIKKYHKHKFVKDQFYIKSDYSQNKVYILAESNESNEFKKSNETLTDYKYNVEYYNLPRAGKSNYIFSAPGEATENKILKGDTVKIIDIVYIDTVIWYKIEDKKWVLSRYYN